MSSVMAPNVQAVDSPGRRTVYSMCGMCAVRCALEVTVDDGRVTWLQGNPHDTALGTSLCAKGSAGLAFEFDDERPQTPLIRSGPRGGGQWRRVSWDEALDYIADKLHDTIEDVRGTRYRAVRPQRPVHRPDPHLPAGARLAELLQPRRQLRRQRPQRGALALRLRSRGAPVRLGAHQAPGALRPQPARVADGQGGQGVHGGDGERDALHLHRSPRHDHRLQGHPLLAGPPQQRLRAEPRHHSRDPRA